MSATIQHPKTWWFKLAERWFPDRCREVPEAVNPNRIVMRQFALFGRHLYLQQFCSDEDPRFLHCHQWHRTVALGLWGAYTEHRMAGPEKRRRAPYCYTMGPDVIHHVQKVTPGHTSLFLGLWRNDDLKHYYGAPQTLADKSAMEPGTFRRTWDSHIKKMVKRI
jgi:hypothetical protein